MPSALPAKSGLGPLNGTCVGSFTRPLATWAVGALAGAVGVHALASITALAAFRKSRRLAMRVPPPFRSIPKVLTLPPPPSLAWRYVPAGAPLGHRDGF